MIKFKNLGVAATDGTVTFEKPSQTTITAIYQAGAIANSAGFTYNFTNLLPNETRELFVTMSVPASPIVNLGDLLTASATISAPANDVNLLNNSSSITQIVVNSYDPNDKMESHGEEIPLSQFSPNDDLIYTIRFQNYGTANAIDVRIEDVLDAQIDPESIRMISASHNYVMTRINNNIVWNFANIQLVPLSLNEELSMGYVQFRVKLYPGFAVGSLIPNTASIYFDSNPAIVTNTFTTEFTAALNNLSFDTSNFTLYPNPTSQFVNIALNTTAETIENVIIYDVLGKIIKEVNSVAKNNAKVDTSGLSKGIYLVEITTENGLKQNKKLVIK
ncbi:T9SS type A sorting domain-containing protein [Flavobacterium sp.]|uniref:T9SS type A sorting domain-containing protein n=1 Tax=Flavobacterium sp. TaxID=239 RepID=UPI0026255623|nr:T9SS type A sorting domain-containing protein [Flavobacterium sp.]